MSLTSAFQTCREEPQKSIYFKKTSSFLIMLSFFARDAEDKLDQSRKTGMKRENVLQRYKKEYRNLKMVLIERSKQGKR